MVSVFQPRLGYPFRPKFKIMPEKAKNMTIALGIRCANGALIAADRQVTKNDYYTTSESKVLSFTGVSGIFAIAASSDDLDATRTVVNRIKGVLCTTNIGDDSQLEFAVTKIMTDWYGAYGQIRPPSSALILGSRLNGQNCKLYRCEPPSTFLPQLSYVAVGTGESVTDPVYDLLFDSWIPTTVTSALRRVCYLIYRAKEANAFCGGYTTCVYLGDTRQSPITVRPTDIAEQEKLSEELNTLLHIATIYALDSTSEDIKVNSSGLRDTLEALADIRRTVFHDLSGNEIA